MRRLAAVAAVAVLLLAGCSSEGGGTEPATTPEVSVPGPTGTPDPALRPGADARASSVIRGQGYRIAAPSGYQQAMRTSSNGQPMLQLQRPSSVPDLPTVVAVLREVDPKDDADEVSYALEVARRTADQATDVSRNPVAWPGTRRTVLVQWTLEQPTSDGRRVPMRFWQLNSDISPALRLVVSGSTPVADVGSSAMAEAFASYRPTG